jgi:hypothetical protein
MRKSGARLLFLPVKMLDIRPFRELCRIAQSCRSLVGTLAHIALRCVMQESSESWEEKYLQTILEVNGQKMQERIAATRQAIAGRLQDIEHDSDHHGKRHRIENALTALSQLEVETRQW